jgi:hypothetical protein
MAVPGHDPGIGPRHPAWHRVTTDGRDTPHTHQAKRWRELHTPPPLAGGGWGEGWRQHRSRSRHTWQARLRVASPSPQPPPARGGGGFFSGVALILMRMGTSPAMTVCLRTHQQSAIHPQQRRAFDALLQRPVARISPGPVSTHCEMFRRVCVSCLDAEAHQR